eukprot:1159820-Pelagomonas_calceolata.AAC.1
MRLLGRAAYKRLGQGSACVAKDLMDAHYACWLASIVDFYKKATLLIWGCSVLTTQIVVHQMFFLGRKSGKGDFAVYVCKISPGSLEPFTCPRPV